MKTILVPLDGSALAEHALPYARALADLLSAKVRLLQVISEIDHYNLLVNDVPVMLAQDGAADDQPRPEPTAREFLRQHAASYLAQQADALHNLGVEVDTEVRLGMPAEVIVDTAREQQSALIVMATHGYGGLKRWSLGSVADRVVHGATAPVFLVRGSPEPTYVAAPLKRIMVPLDGSEQARQALPIAVDLTTRARAQLLLLTAVVPSVNVAPELISPLPNYDDVLPLACDRLRAELGDFAGELERQELVVTPVAVNGFPAEIIIDEAARRGVDLIVMATHGYSGLKRWAIGSVADKVLHATRTPLLLVRAQASK